MLICSENAMSESDPCYIYRMLLELVSIAPIN